MKAAGGPDQPRRRGRPKGCGWSAEQRANFAASIERRRQAYVDDLNRAVFEDSGWDELVAAGRCECGRPLEGHPPLPRPRDWAEGRPCGRSLRFPSGSSAGLGVRPKAALPAHWRLHVRERDEGAT